MKKIALAFGLLGLSALANAADPLNGTVWKTIDDKTKQPKATVKFTEQKNGTLTASIQSILTPGEENACTKCEGKIQVARATMVVQSLIPKQVKPTSSKVNLPMVVRNLNCVVSLV